MFFVKNSVLEPIDAIEKLGSEVLIDSRSFLINSEKIPHTLGVKFLS